MTEQRTSRERSADHLRAAIGNVRRTLAASRRMVEMPGHEDRAAQRIVDGEQELALLESQLAVLEDTDPMDDARTRALTEAANDVARLTRSEREGPDERGR